MLKGTILGSIATSFIGPLVVIFILHDFLPASYLFIWLCLHVVLLIVRISFTKKLLHDLEIDANALRKKLIYSLILTSLGAILYGIIIWLAVLYEIPELNIILVTTAIVTLAAGSISTLGSVFHSFILFLLILIFPLIGALLYHGGEMFNLISFIITVFILVHISAGYRYYITLRNAVSLKESFETIFNQSPDGIMLIKETRFKDCNDSVVSMFGYDSKKQFLSTHLQKFSPKYQPDGSSSTRKMILILKKAWDERKNSYEWLHVKANGELFWAEVVLTQIHLDGEDLIHGVWRNINDRKIAEFKIEALNSTLEKCVEIEIEKNRLSNQKLLQHSRLAQMGEMISMIAHQWRQPLGAISTTAVNLKLKLELEAFDLETKEGVQEANTYFLKRLSNIEDYVGNLTTTIDDFRNFYKPNKESIHVTFESVAAKALDIIGASLANDNVELIYEYHSQEMLEMYDSEMMQVILNILKNSQDNFKDKEINSPYVKITTQDASISICDNGRGISKDILPNIFDPYFSTKDEKNGTGLGLYMSKIIVEDHHKGCLHVSNKNGGVCFTIALKGHKNDN